MERVVKYCDCKSAFQDATYGKGMRLYRVATKKEAMPRERCTVCYQIRAKSRLKSCADGHRPIHSTPPKSKGPYYV